jgi:hypothetical protein
MINLFTVRQYTQVSELESSLKGGRKFKNKEFPIAIWTTYLTLEQVERT